MKPKTLMLIAGEASGDLLGAELVEAVRSETGAGKPEFTTDYQPLHTDLAPRFFGAGGPRMSGAGVDLAFDLTQHSVIGLSDVFKNLLKFRRLLLQLYRLALGRQPDAVVCIDFSGFNRRLAHAIKRHVRARQDWFHDWNPKIIQYVSPQVWASRERRAAQMARDYDLVLSLFPFEKGWYAQRVPALRVEFVGNPMIDRYASLVFMPESRKREVGGERMIVLLPGSRTGEVARHLPVMLGALEQLQAAIPGLRSRMVLPNETLLAQARSFGMHGNLTPQVGGLPEVLAQADLAIASTGTVTMECAYFRVPTVALYKTSWSTYQIGKRLVKVPYLAMPNLLANEEVFPEFIQDAATPANIAQAARGLLEDDARRAEIQARLGEILAGLGGPGASRRAARAICGLLRPGHAVGAAH